MKPAVDNEFSLDRKALARAFERAGPHYDAQLPALRSANAELLERLRFFKLDPKCILDLGAGSGEAARSLRQQFPTAQVVAVDLAPAMLRTAPRAWWPRARFHRLAADAHALALASHSIDLVYSNLMLPFCDQPLPVFQELARVLKPGGLFVFSTFGPDTLHELRTAWRHADERTHVSQFLDVPQLGDALMQSGLIEPVIDVERHQLHYPDAQTLMRELKRMGGQNAAQGRSRTLTGKASLQKMIAAYEQLRTGAGLPATFELVIGAAFGAPPGSQDGAGSRTPGEFAVPIDSVRRTRR